MKKFISIMLCICICLSSVTFCFAEAWTSYEAQQVTNNVSKIFDMLRLFLGSDGSTSISYNWSEFASEFFRVWKWMVPDGVFSRGSSGIGGLSFWECIDYIATTISGAWSNWEVIWSSTNVNTQNTVSYLDDLKLGLTNYRFGSSGTSAYTWQQVAKNGHGQLFTGTVGQPMNGVYTFRQLTPNGLYQESSNTLQWQYGSPIGNLALEFQRYNNNFVYGYLSMSNRMLTDYTGQLGVWDSQGDTLTQEAWSPTSAINGLYKYLAYIQRDVSRLTYVMASDEEIEAREEAKANQTEVFDNFIDPSGSGSASPSDISSVSDLSSGFKNNISTDASVSGIWNIFNSDNFGWFSQETADQLDTTASNTRTLKSSGSYPTPLLDQQTEDILKYIGGENND